MSSPCGRQDAEILVNQQSLRRAFSWVLVPGIFAKFRGGVNVSWKPRMLAFTAILWVWSDEATLKKRFAAAGKLVIKLFRWHEKPGTSYRGFTKALSQWSVRLLGVILPHGWRPFMTRHWPATLKHCRWGHSLHMTLSGRRVILRQVSAG